MSLGYGNFASNQTDDISDELANLESMGVISVASAGNSFYNVSSVPGVAYPAADANTISVGATWDENIGSKFWGNGAIDYSSGVDRVVSFSQRHSTMLDILAPGAEITAAGLGGTYVNNSGTSMSAPHVVAAVAMAQQVNEELNSTRLSQADMVNLLQNTGRRLHLRR